MNVYSAYCQICCNLNHYLTQLNSTYLGMRHFAFLLFYFVGLTAYKVPMKYKKCLVFCVKYRLTCNSIQKFI
jgi:hypothetical protein